MRNKCGILKAKNTSHNPALNQTANPGGFFSVGKANYFQGVTEGYGQLSAAG